MDSDTCNWHFKPTFMNVLYMILLIPVIALISDFAFKGIGIMLAIKLGIYLFENFKKESSSENWDGNVVWEKIRVSFLKALRECQDFGSSLYKKIWNKLFGCSAPLTARVPYEMKETIDSIIINVDIPGVEKEDITVETKENIITIKGSRVSENDENDHVLSSSITFGDYSIDITVPDSGDANQVIAKYDRGVLTLSIPKKEEAVNITNKIHID